ncbi:ATP-binding protein [Nocardioides sp. SR21]|uniref:ATP-binding protein n=1 Tax=Nocardioides sp. SR21 TaxID=2919501 RepID=UPI001FAA48B7|nr:ATP-binding protein [Nocardioides sp. SR21]
MACLLAAMMLFGITAVHATPAGGTAIGIWPIGGATACLMMAARPRTPVLLALIAAVAVSSIWIGGRDADVALGLGLGMTAGAWVMWRIFTGGRRVRPELRSTGDLARFAGGATLSAFVAAAAAYLTSMVTGWSDPSLLALALLTSNLGSQLVVVPFFSRLRLHASAARPSERVLQWVVILTLSPLVFLPHDFPSIAFMVLPVLTWCALRTAPFEALSQMVVVLAFAVICTTYDRGPFANAGLRFGFSPDSQGILLSTFVIVCAFVVVPLLLAVGEQLESARQVAAERDKVQNIVNGATGVAIIGTDEHGLVTLVNPGAERLLGYSAAELLGRTTDLLHSQEELETKGALYGTEPTLGAVAAAVIDTGPVDMAFVRKDGEERMHSMTLNRVHDDRGEVTGYVSTSEDITDRVKAQQKLVEALETERQAVERLREVDQVKDAFVSSVSHELRTPITSILGYTEMLEEGVYGDLAPAQLDALSRVATNSTRLLSLIDDLLTLSRVQEDGLAMVDRLVDLRKIVAAACSVVAPTAELRDLELVVDLPDEPVPFLGDRDMLERVVINLVGNAVKFTPEQGRVTVSLRPEGDAAVIAVADTGIGIPLAEQERLFSRFFRSSLAQEQAIPGSGLGLSIAHAIVEKHGGEMRVESEPGQGTTFFVRLPLLTRV